jgi:allophanate hydrolase subunit 2
MANALVGNNENEAVLEITMSGPKLEFQTEAIIAITGANLNPKLNSKEILNNRLLKVSESDILSFGNLVSGFRCYLAVSGGFQTKAVLGSKSMYTDITQYDIIKKNDFFSTVKSDISNEKQFSGLKVNDSYLKSSTLEVLKGLEFDSLTTIQKEKLLSKTFKVSKDNNRMAYQLEEHIENNLKPIITSPVIPGTVQLTPSGKIIILMRDCQTTGGYPRILQLTTSAINMLAQKFTGNTISFKLKD